MAAADAGTLLAFALELADAADAVSLPAFLDAIPARDKADGTPVTDADTAVETLIRERIADAWPEHAILGEEFGAAGDQGTSGSGPARVRWIVDPIDGTANFVRRTAVWATLIAAEVDGELAVAVVSAPAMSQRWWASRGGGAWTAHFRRERAIRVSTVGRLADAQVVHAGVAAMEREGIGPGFRAVLAGAKRDRGFGDALGYMLVAQGSAEVMVETGVSVWDLAAPALVVTEAGGRFGRADGSAGYDGPTALATNGRVHDEVLRQLGATAEPARIGP
jgi:histidinol-phosphatase